MKFGKAAICLIFALLLINIIPYLGIKEAEPETIAGIILLIATIVAVISIVLDLKKSGGDKPSADNKPAKKKSTPLWTSDDTKGVIRPLAVGIIIIAGFWILIDKSKTELKTSESRSVLTTGLIGYPEEEKVIVFSKNLQANKNYTAFKISRTQPITLNKFQSPIEIRINSTGKEIYTRYLPEQAGINFKAPYSGKLEIRSRTNNNHVTITREAFSMWQSY